MWFNILVLFTALTISGVAAYYSIIGLTAIFAAAFWPIVIMGGALEVGKIVASVWLKKYWTQVAWPLKTYLTTAVAILMFITSIGIFGFLSKAHLDQAVPMGDVAAKVQLLDEKIKTERDNVETARRALSQMDAQVDQRLNRSTDDKGAERAVQIRRQQAKERQQLQNEIAAAQKRIAALNEERAPIATELRKVEAEVGPIKYVAALIYGDQADNDLLEKAVRWVIIVIVAVFDPLAIALILAANSSMRWAAEPQPVRKEEDKSEEESEPEEDYGNCPQCDTKLELAPGIGPFCPNKECDVKDGWALPQEESKDEFDIAKHAYLHKPWVGFASGAPMVATPEPQIETVIEPTPEPIKQDIDPAIIEELTANINELTNKVENLQKERNQLFIAHGQELTRADNLAVRLDEIDSEVSTLLQQLDEKNQRIEELSQHAQELEQSRETLLSKQAELERASQDLADLLQASVNKEQALQQGIEKLKQVKQREINNLQATIRDLEDQIKKLQQQIAEATAEPELDLTATPTNAGFGTAFPDAPTKGDMFVRVDYLPSRVFKFNGDKWIEIDKNITDTYSFNKEYIAHLVTQLEKGEIELDQLSDSEQAQIKAMLKKEVVLGK